MFIFRSIFKAKALNDRHAISKDHGMVKYDNWHLSSPLAVRTVRR